MNYVCDADLFRAGPRPSSHGRISQRIERKYNVAHRLQAGPGRGRHPAHRGPRARCGATSAPLPRPRRPAARRARIAATGCRRCISDGYLIVRHPDLRDGAARWPTGWGPSCSLRELTLGRKDGRPWVKHARACDTAARRGEKLARVHAAPAAGPARAREDDRGRDDRGGRAPHRRRAGDVPRRPRLAPRPGRDGDARAARRPALRDRGRAASTSSATSTRCPLEGDCLSRDGGAARWA